MLVERELSWLIKQNVGELSTVLQFENALTNDVFLLTNKQNKRFIFKRLNRNARSDEDRKSEFLVQQLAFQQGLTTQVLAHDQDYKLQHYIEGQLILKTGDNLNQLLATQLQRIHHLPALHAPTQRLVFELKQLKSQLPVNIDETRFQQMLQLANRLDDSSPRDTLCHGDLSLNNILQADNKQLYILDWEYAVIAGISYDLAFCNCINGFTVTEGNALIETYYGQLSEPKQISLQSLQKECYLYLKLFNYINELWGICFVDNG